MLDQNTDRMWYVIGAVLVGAAIILIANNTMPQMFASVGDMMVDMSSKVYPDSGDLNRVGELRNHYMWNVEEGHVVPRDAIAAGTDVDHSTPKDKMKIPAGSTIRFEKTGLDELPNTTKGGNYWRISQYDVDENYLRRVVFTDNFREYTFEDDVHYIWFSYPTKSNPKVTILE